MLQKLIYQAEKSIAISAYPVESWSDVGVVQRNTPNHLLKIILNVG
jgi:hypothetical protein